VRASFNGLTADATFTVTDPCASIQPGSIASGQTINGTLSRVDDCLNAANRLEDSYTFSLGSTTLFNFVMSTDGFTPLMYTHTAAGAKLSGLTSGNANLTGEHLYPAGSYVAAAASLEAGGGIADAVEGNYTLSMNSVGTPQEGCKDVETFVRLGVSASGSITSSDCEDEFDNEPSVVRRWDGFALIADGSQGTVSVQANIPYRFAHWVGSTLQGVMTNIPANETAFFVGGLAPNEYNQFYPINEEHDATGSYTITFTPGIQSIQPNLVRGQFSHPAQVASEGSFTLDLSVVNIGGDMPASASSNYSVSVYIAAQQSLNGPQAFLGTMAFSGQLLNAQTDSRSQLFTLPAISGPHFILVEVDGSNGVSESNENNLFVLRAMNVN